MTSAVAGAAAGGEAAGAARAATGAKTQTGDAVFAKGKYHSPEGRAYRAKYGSGSSGSSSTRSTGSSSSTRSTRSRRSRSGGGSVSDGLLGGTLAGRQTAKTNRAVRRVTHGQRLLVVEFLACSLILALSPLTDKHKTDSPGKWIQRASGVCGLFIVLGLIGAAGPKSARVAAGLGGLVTVTLAVSDRNLFAVIAGRLGAAPSSGPAGPGSVRQGVDVPTMYDTQPGLPDGVPDGGVSPTLPGTPARPGRNSRIRPI